MPTQVRLITDDINANFNSNFVEEIFIPKNSKIALNTLCMESSLKAFNINGNNETFSLRCRDSDGNGNLINNNLFSNLTFRNGAYNSKSEVDALFTALKKRLNEINLTALTQSLSFIVSSSDQDNFFSLTPFKTPLSSFISSAFYINTENTDPTGNTGLFKKTANTNANNFDNYVAYAHSLQKGIGRTICQLGIMTGGSGNAPPSSGTDGILMALVEKQPASDGSTSYALSDIKYGIYLNNQSSNYYTVYNGAETNSNEAIQSVGGDDDDDFMSIEKEGTNFVYKIYQPSFNGRAGRTLTIATQPIGNVNTNYYPVIFFKGAGNTAQARVLASTFDLSEDEELKDNLAKNELSGGAPSNSHNPRMVGFDASFPIQLTLTFSKTTTAKFLGFNNLSKTAFEENDLQEDLRGDNEIQFLVEADYHVVVLDNIKLKNYDGITNSRQNILAYIPKSEGENGEVIYEPNNLYYVDLDNREDLKIKNIRARILDKELNPIETNGISVFSFLIN